MLLAAGCADRPLTDLEARVAPLADDPFVAGALDAETLGRLRALVPALERRCRDLAAAGLPETLVHGDLGAHNVAVAEGRPLFFDWAEGCVSHPFLDMLEAVEDPAAFAPAKRRYLDACGGSAWRSGRRRRKGVSRIRRAGHPSGHQARHRSQERGLARGAETLAFLVEATGGPGPTDEAHLLNWRQTRSVDT